MKLQQQQICSISSSGSSAAWRQAPLRPRRRPVVVVVAAAAQAPSTPRGRQVVMRPLGEPGSSSSSSSNRNGTAPSSPPPPPSPPPQPRFDPASRSNGAAASTSYNSRTNGNGSSNGNGNGSNNSIVLARQPVSTLTAVRLAAAAGAESLAQSPQSPASASGGARELPTDVDFKWAQDSYSVTQRNVDTWAFFLLFRTRLWLLDKKFSYVGGFTEAKRSARARALARYLLDAVLNLGPTFIKVGQLSSTRSDLFPPEFIEELAYLQDRVPAFPADKAEAIIEQDLGRPVAQLFRTFDRRPIAAASLGQVHLATLHSGEQVVVKVQRPGLKALFDIDLNNLRILATQLDRGDEARDFKGIYQECASVLYGEIDYIKEGRSADRFRRNFRDVPWVRTPIVHWAYSSPRVLTLEYLPGTKITDAQGLAAQGVPRELVARRMTEAYLTQILTHGFFHADPHPGNVCVDASGRLLFYDFGMMGEIVPNVRERLLDLFYAVYKKDTAGVVRSLVELGVLRPSGDMLALRRAIGYFVDNLARQTERQETIANIGEDLFSIALDQPVRFPANFTFVLRAFSTIEGIGKTLDPDYNFSAVATPYAQELLQLADGGQRAFLLDELQKQASDLTAAAAAMPFRVRRIDNTIEELETGDLKLRVRVLEGERAARRQGVMQVATLNTVASVGLLNVGTQLALHGGLEAAAGVCFALSAGCAILVALGFKRVARLDKFEKDLRG